MQAAAPAALPIVPFGMAFGLAASEKGLSLELGMLMSITVFAGLSQLAVLELWATPLPVIPILLITLTLNLRHILYGAALTPWTRGVRAWQRNLSATVMADINWALTMQAKERGETDVGYLFGGGIVLYAIWQLGSLAGFLLGGGLGDPKQFGLDAVVISLFATTLVGLWRGRDDILPWCVAGAAALAAFEFLPPGWHIIVGAIAGGIAGVLPYAKRTR